MSKPTKGRIKAEHYKSEYPGASDITIYTQPNEYTPELWIASTKSDKPEDEANAALIVAAWNACVEVNPDNPIAVAQAMPEIFQLLLAAVNDAFKVTGKRLDPKEWLSAANAAILKATARE